MLKIFLLILAVCTDCFAAAIGLCSAGIKIPTKSTVIISIVGTISLTLSVYFADIIKTFIPVEICSMLSFILLVTLGLFNIFQNTVKHLLKKKELKNNNPVNLFFNQTAADADNSKTISPKEALFLSIALSADSLVTGISAGFASYNIVILTVMAFIVGFCLIKAGCFIGTKIISSKKINLNWICGLMLILLAFLR